MGLAAVVAALVVTAGCADDTTTEPAPEPVGEQRYVRQGTQTAYEDLLIGLMDVSSEGEALMQVYADDAESEVVTAAEGDTFQVGRRSVTVVQVDTDPDGVLLDVVDPEAPKPSAEPQSPPGNGTADSGGDPMDDPAVQAVLLGRQVVAAPGLRIGLGTTVNDTARILLTPDGGEDQEREVRAGDRIEMAGHTVTVVEVGDGVLYFRVDQ